MDFRILGPLEVHDDGRSVELGGARQRALLAILLLRRNDVVSPDVLIEELYGGRAPPTAAKSLQAHISRLRSALRPEVRVHTRPGGYVLEVRPDELDADRATMLLAEARAERAAGDPGAAATVVASALGLWRGQALADVAYEGFAQDDIARLDELRLECIEERLDIDLEQGRHATVIGDAERLVADYPFRERLRGQLMVVLYRCGRQAEALAAYQDVRRVLLDGLGIEPGRALQELERAILNQDPRLDPGPGVDPPEAADHRGRRAAGVFVGRDRELGEILAAFDDARLGTGRLVLLTGEPGIGKSRLADELSAHAHARGATVLWGRCWEAGGAPAYWPWVQALRSYVRDRDRETLQRQLGAGTPDLAHLLPDLRDLFPDAPELHDLESEGARFRLFDAVATFLRNASEDAPLVLVLDDLHVADAPSLLMLQFVAAGIADTRVTLLAIYRDPDPDHGGRVDVRLVDLGRAASVRIALRGLAAADVASYVRSSANVEPPPSVVDAIVRDTEGNPLFVGEVVRLLVTEGSIDRPLHPSWRLPVPSGVREVIERRLRHVSPECIETLTLASVLGREFGLDALERLGPRSASEVLDVLDQAVAARVVADVPATAGRLRFAHALIRDTLYDSLTPARRIALHRDAGEALEALYARHPEAHLSELAHHFALAAPGGDRTKAVDYASQAGAHASQLLAHEEAARLYELALSVLELDRHADAALECRLTLALGEALARGGDLAQAKDAFLRAASIARSLSDAEGLAAAALGYGGRIVWARAAGDRLVVALLEEALDMLGAEDSPLRTRVLARLAGALRDEGIAGRRIKIGEDAVSAARRLGDEATLAYALGGLCAAQHSLANHERRLEVARELRDVAAAIEDRESVGDALTAEILVYATRNDYATVRANLAAYAAFAEELAQPSQAWLAQALEAMLALQEGRLEDAERLVPAAYELGRRAQATESFSAYAMQLYVLRRERGQLEDAQEPMTRAVAQSQARPVFRCALAALAAELDDHVEARRGFEDLAANDFQLVPRDNEWLLAAAFLAETARALGDISRMAVLHAELAPHADWSTANPPEGSLGSVARTLGILAGGLGRHEDAVNYLRRAVEIDRSIGATPWVAHAQVELAALVEPAEAVALRGEAAANASALGMERLGARLSARG